MKALIITSFLFVYHTIIGRSRKDGSDHQRNQSHCDPSILEALEMKGHYMPYVELQSANRGSINQPTHALRK